MGESKSKDGEKKSSKRQKSATMIQEFQNVNRMGIYGCHQGKKKNTMGKASTKGTNLIQNPNKWHPPAQ